jgi:hypothetical protein
MIMISLPVKENQKAAAHVTVERFATAPVLTVAGALGVLLLVANGRYGYFGDELYFLAAGRHLSWGYADQPPLLPLLARAMDAVAPGSLEMLRLPAVLCMVAGVVLTALIARELGGGRKAQVLAAGAFAVSTQFLGSGHYLATSTVDPFLWTLLLWLIVRWVRTRSDGLLVWAGVVTAVALNVKFLVLGFWPVAGICLLVFGPRELLRRPLLWAGAAIAAAGFAPTLIWQATHGWPQLAMNRAITAEVAELGGGRVLFVPIALASAGLIVGAVLLVHGTWRLTRSDRLRPYRFLGWTALGVTVLFLALGGRYYYVAGMFPVCWAAAAVEIERKSPSRWWRWVPTWPVYLIGALAVLPLALSVWPQSWLTTHPELPRPMYSGEEIGWPSVAASVAQQYFRLPADQRARTALVAEKYWQASALDRYGQALGLPEPASPNRGYFTLTSPPARTDSVLYVGRDPRPLLGHFGDLTRLGTVDTGTGLDNSSQGMPVWLATGREEPWSVIWPELRDFAP